MHTITQIISRTSLNTEDKVFLTIAGFITLLVLVVLLMELISVIKQRVKKKFKHRKINKRNR